MSRPKDPWVFVGHIFEAIQDIKNYTGSVKDLDGFLKDERTQDAVIRKFEIIGEAANNLPREFLDSYPEVNWQDLIDFRNVMIHKYFEIDVEAVWEATNKDLPVLESQIEKLLKKEDRG